MKKSEMINLLKQDIKDAAGDLNLQAEMVLARCQSIGMYPPEAADFNIGNNWEPEEDEDIPYGKSVVEQVNAEIKELNRIVDELAEINTVEERYSKDISDKISNELLKSRDELTEQCYKILRDHIK